MAKEVGKIGWIDLTVENADNVRDFYADVVGWNHTPVSMGDYDDYCMLPPGEENPVAGICFKKGSNQSLPSQWLMYITIENLTQSLEQVTAKNGTVLFGPKTMSGHGTYAVIKDPAGAVCALFEME